MNYTIYEVFMSLCDVLTHTKIKITEENKDRFQRMKNLRDAIKDCLDNGDL